MSKKVSLKQNIGVTTVCIICITTVFTLLQFIYPQVLSSLRRNPTALYSGQWWRLFTPLLVHSDKNAWVQFIINMLGIAILGTAVERLVGGYKFLLLYLAGGLGGEIAGYSGWDPFGAGASVGLCGLLGGLFIFLIKGKSKMTPIIPVISLYFIAGLLGNASGNYVFTILICLLVAVLQMLAMKNKENIKLISFIIGVLGALGGIILIILKDIHGVAIITGSCMALMILSLDKQINILGEAENGKKLFEVLSTKTPDVILMDIRMPVMDGVEATRLIKEKYPDIKVIILTTFNEDEYIFKGLKYGADGYILKDSGSDDIINAIKTAYGGNILMNPEVAKKIVNVLTSTANYNLNITADTDSKLKLLTPREMDVAKLIADGKTNKFICETLFLTEGTVKNYVTKILEKLELNSRTELALYMKQYRI